MRFIAILAVLCYTDSNVTAEGKAGGKACLLHFDGQSVKI